MNIRQYTVRHPAISSLVLIAIVMLIVMSLTGCGKRTNASAISEEDIGGTTQTPPPIDTMRHLFGETHTYDDGITVTISEPQQFELSEIASLEGDIRAHQIAFEVTVTNNSSETFQPEPYPEVTSDGSTATLIHDVENPFGDFSFSSGTPLDPGESRTYLHGYSVDSMDSITVELSPTWQHDDVRFTNILP